MSALPRLLRLPNLLIVALTQYLVRAELLLPHLGEARLPWFDVGLLLGFTVLATAGGYVVNDIMDAPIDRINKPGRVLVGARISEAAAWRMYWALLLLGGLAAGLFAARVGWHFLWVYGLTSAALYAYARYLKRSTLWGNLLVALLCALVPLLPYWAERPALPLAIGHLLWGYVGFAFASTLFRELVKDLEDVAGDRAGGCRTLPIAYGTALAKRVALGTGALVLAGLAAYAGHLALSGAWLRVAYVGLALLWPALWALRRLRSAQGPGDFHRVSTGIKWLMLSGLLYLLLP